MSFGVMKDYKLKRRKRRVGLREPLHLFFFYAPVYVRERRVQEFVSEAPCRKILGSHGSHFLVLKSSNLIVRTVLDLSLTVSKRDASPKMHRFTFIGSD
jgi:hypothetical protein